MKSFGLIVAICCAVISLVCGGKVTPEVLVRIANHYSAGKDLFFAPVPSSKNHLRTTTTTEANLASSSSYNVIKVNGYFEAVKYKKTACSYPLSKDLILLNTCGPAINDGAYVSYKIMADMTQTHLYYATQYFFSDSECQNGVGVAYYEVPILKCYKNSLAHVIKEPLNPKTDNLNGFAIGVFDTQANCQSASSPEGLLEAEYFRLQQCYQDYDGDRIFNSCQSNTLTVTTFTSTDGSCTGSSTVDTVLPSQMCANPSWDLSAFSGWLNFVCE
jgi:hypothetical protein